MNNRNARFWDYVNGSNVRLTLRPGQSVRWSSGIVRHDEGWSSESREWAHTGNTVVSETSSSGRDCDGRLVQFGAAECSLDRLSAVPADEYGPSRPDWKRIKEACGQRDYTAEAAGY